MDYTYYLRTSRSVADVERLIARATSDAAWRSDPAKFPEPITVYVTPPGVREMIAEYYDFEPTVGVSVQLDKFVEERRDREAQALDILAVLLRDDDGDLYADYYDGKPALLRRSGAVTADERWLASRPWAADSLPVPIRTGEVPSTV